MHFVWRYIIEDFIPPATEPTSSRIFADDDEEEEETEEVPFSYSQASAYESSQTVEPPIIPRRRSKNEILGDPTLDDAFRAELRARCKANDWPKLEIRRDLFLRGSGIFATAPIRAGEFVCSYAGILVPNDHYDRLINSVDEEKRKKIEEYALGGHKYTILAHEECIVDEHSLNLKATFGRVLNHSHMHANIKAPQWYNLAPKGEKQDWHALQQVQYIQ